MMKAGTANASAERRMMLLKTIRNESQNNRTQMRTREQILYGAGGGLETDIPFEDVPQVTFVSLKLRAIVALLLFIGFVTWDNGAYPTTKQHTGQVYEMIAADSITGNLFAFMEDIPYTLESE